MRTPAFQFYPDDFVSGVSTMTQAEVGAYILLLCHQWNVGKVSDDVARMEIVAKGKVSEHVLSKFPRGKNRRLEFEREKQRIFRESRSKNGKLGGRPRKASENLVVLKNEPKKSFPSPSPSPSPFVLNTTGGQPEIKIEMALGWLNDWRRNGANYTEAETRSAFNALAASGWMWGKNAVVDHRAALERQIQTDRERKAPRVKVEAERCI
jgi:uncharacterized protein YdaU (DUF1376 family)